MTDQTESKLFASFTDDQIFNIAFGAFLLFILICGTAGITLAYHEDEKDELEILMIDRFDAAFGMVAIRQMAENHYMYEYLSTNGSCAESPPYCWPSGLVQIAEDNPGLKSKLDRNKILRNRWRLPYTYELRNQVPFITTEVPNQREANKVAEYLGGPRHLEPTSSGSFRVAHVPEVPTDRLNGILALVQSND